MNQRGGAKILRRILPGGGEGVRLFFSILFGRGDFFQRIIFAIVFSAKITLHVF